MNNNISYKKIAIKGRGTSLNKILNILLTFLILFVLIGCGNNISDDLQSTKWNVVATNGESYTAEFGEKTVSFKIGTFSRGFNYTINDGEIRLEEENKEPIIFKIEKDGKEYIFKAGNEDVKNQFGDLRLSQSK